MSRRIESLFIEGPAGRLEALLEEPETGEPREIALVCHPHPKPSVGPGGSMHNKVVHRVARGLRRTGAVVLRFNYRGVNLSEGTYDNGVGEREDASAALALLRTRYPGLPLTLAGFSFGSRIALQLACSDAGARRVLAVGFPTIYRDRSYLEGCTVPRIFIQSTRDEFGPVADLTALFDTLPQPKQLHWIDAANHFFVGSLDAVEEAVATLDSM
jgi:uncharacterized protein